MRIYLFFVLICLIAGCGGGAGNSEIEVVDFSPYAGQKTRSASRWHIINSSPPFGPRDHASLMKVNNRIHLRGGFFRGRSVYQDYWISDDLGVNWMHIYGSTLPLFNDLVEPTLYPDLNIPGAMARFSYYQSFYFLIDEFTWYSSDSIIWSKYLGLKGDPKYGTELSNIVHRDKLYAINTDNNQIWNIDLNFERSQSRKIHDQFKTGAGATVYSIGDYLYIAGGFNFDNMRAGFNNAIWRSLDGMTWRKLVNEGYQDVNLPWSNIIWPCVVKDDRERVWLVGGFDVVTNNNVSDVWYTVDGFNWMRYEDGIADGESSSLFPRHATACVFDEVNRRIISIGGKGGVNPDNNTASVTNDIIGIPIP